MDWRRVGWGEGRTGYKTYNVLLEPPFAFPQEITITIWEPLAFLFPKFPQREKKKIVLFFCGNKRLILEHKVTSAN